MIDINDYCGRLKRELLSHFGESLRYMGLQGSYLRGEATEESDIDIVVILDRLTTEDMDLYRNIIQKIGSFEKSCGFICSAEDMKNWTPLEVCHLRHSTKDIYGDLSDFLPEWNMNDEVNFIKMSLNNLYHELCHGYIHGEREKQKYKLVYYYKSAFFILQNIHYLETYRNGKAEFVQTKSLLTEKLRGDDNRIMEVLLDLINGKQIDFNSYFELILHWCQRKMATIDRY